MKIPVFVSSPTALNAEQAASRAVHTTPSHTITDDERSGLREVFLKWHSKASARYYGA